MSIDLNEEARNLILDLLPGRLLGDRVSFHRSGTEAGLAPGLVARIQKPGYTTTIGVAASIVEDLGHQLRLGDYDCPPVEAARRWVKTLLQEIRMSQRQLAIQTGVDIDSVNRFLNGRYQDIRLSTLNIYFNYLKTEAHLRVICLDRRDR